MDFMRYAAFFSKAKKVGEAPFKASGASSNLNIYIKNIGAIFLYRNCDKM